MMKYGLIQAIAFSMLVFSGLATAEVLVVDPGGEAGFLTLETAIAAATDGDVVELVDGDHIWVSEYYVEKSGLVFRSASGDPSKCRIVSEVPFWVAAGGAETLGSVAFYDLGFNVTFIGLMYCEYTVVGCYFDSGGVNALDRSPGTIENTTFNYCQAFGGSAEMVLRSCVFANYSSLSCSQRIGGSPTSFIMEDCDFVNALGVQLRADDIRLERCTFTEGGSGFKVEITTNNELLVSSCLFAENQCDIYGALSLGAGALGVTMTVNDCIFRDNASDGNTAGLGLFYGGLNEASFVTCNNVEFVGNTAINGFSDTFVAEGCNLILNCCQIDEANIGGAGETHVTSIDCAVGIESTSWGDLKASYRD